MPVHTIDGKENPSRADGVAALRILGIELHVVKHCVVVQRVASIEVDRQIAIVGELLLEICVGSPGRSPVLGADDILRAGSENDLGTVGINKESPGNGIQVDA